MSKICNNNVNTIFDIEFIDNRDINKMVLNMDYKNLKLGYFPIGFIYYGFFTVEGNTVIYHYNSNIKNFDINNNAVPWKITLLNTIAYLTNTSIMYALTKEYIYFIFNGFVFRVNNTFDKRRQKIKNFFRNNINTNDAKLICYLSVGNNLLSNIIKLRYSTTTSHNIVMNNTYSPEDGEIVIFSNYLQDILIKKILSVNKAYSVKIIYGRRE